MEIKLQVRLLSKVVSRNLKMFTLLTVVKIPLPTDTEVFLENHINSLKGSSLIHSAQILPSTVTPIYEAEATKVIFEISKNNSNDNNNFNNRHDIENWSSSDSDQIIVDNRLLEEINMDINTSEECQEIVKSPVFLCHSGKYKI